MARKGFLLYVPEDVATQPLNGRCITNSWWIVHPQFGLAFYEWGDDEPSPQCNIARGLIERFVSERGMYAGHVAKFMPVVFTRHATRERAKLKEQGHG